MGMLTDDQIAKLGQIPDSHLAREVGCAVTTVRRERKRRKIPPAPPGPYLPDKIIKVLGTAPDRAIAEKLNVRIGRVQRWRAHYGIKSWQEQLKHLTEEQESRLGTAPDTDLARDFGVSVDVIRKLRRSRKIRAYRTDHLTERQVAMLGKVSDHDLSKLWGWTAPRVRRARMKRGIQPVTAPKRYTPDELALICAYNAGEISMGEVSRKTGRPIGGLYHRAKQLRTQQCQSTDTKTVDTNTQT